MKNHGFTLIEPLVVIAMLAAMLFPALAAGKIRAQQTPCLNNLKQAGLAYAMYRGDNNDLNCPQRMCPDTPNDPYGLFSPVPGGTSTGTPHHPPRHHGRFNGPFYDGHVQATGPADLSVRNFHEPGLLPAESAHPGE